MNNRISQSFQAFEALKYSNLEINSACQKIDTEVSDHSIDDLPMDNRVELEKIFSEIGMLNFEKIMDEFKSTKIVETGLNLSEFLKGVLRGRGRVKLALAFLSINTNELRN